MKELLDLYSMNAQFEQAYEMAKSFRRKLELCFSPNASQRVSELEGAVKRYIRVMVHAQCQ